MISRLRNYLLQLRDLERIATSLSRGNASASLRAVVNSLPSSWEFCGFSQNGEDGIIDFLLQRLSSTNRYFIEIGAADGLENNTTWLALVKKFSGLWIEGDRSSAEWSKYIFTRLNYGLESVCLFANRDTAKEIVSRSLFPDPDLLSVDIDGIDYYVVEALLKSGLRPKIVVVEYNSALGPDASVTIPYAEDFCRDNTPPGTLYYGCSIGAWRRLAETWNYRFITVEVNGANAFFVDPAAFPDGFLQDIRPLQFAENFSQRRIFRADWESQFQLISDKAFVRV